MKYLLLFFLIFNVKAETTPSLISVIGKCERDIEPDRIKVRYTIQSLDKKSTVKSNQKAGKIYNELLAQLKEKKLSDIIFKTESYRTFPHRVWENKKNVLKGYKTQIILSLETSDLKRGGELLEYGSQMGAESTDGPNPFVSRKLYQKIYKECLKTASQSARKKADSLAKFHGVKLGNVFSISEMGGTNQGHHPMRRSKMMLSAAAMESSSVEVEYGKEKLTIQLPVSYYIKN